MSVDLDEAVFVLERRTALLWLLTLVFFGVGDLVTTVVGFRSFSAVEAGPVVAPMIDRYGTVVMPVMKTAAILVCFGLWKVTPRPINVGVPLGLAVLGILVTGWNIVVLSGVL